MTTPVSALDVNKVFCELAAVINALRPPQLVISITLLELLRQTTIGMDPMHSEVEDLFNRYVNARRVEYSQPDSKLI